MRKPVLSALLILSFWSFPAFTHAQSKPINLDPSYNHDRFGTMPKDIVRHFRAFTTSFDSKDDNDGDGKGEVWGIPEWVAYQIKKFDGDCIPTKGRPGWFTEDALKDQGISPDDNSYKYSQNFRNNHRGWYIRGHLAMKFLAERLGNDAAHNTHTFLNAVPQRDKFNGGIWQSLENLTGAWAQRFGSVWVITGPIILDGLPSGSIGEEGEFKVAIPDALFKIVVKDSDDPDKPDVLAFIYPQKGRHHKKKPFNHEDYLSSIDRIEDLTNLNFFTTLSDTDQEAIEGVTQTELWE